MVTDHSHQRQKKQARKQKTKNGSRHTSVINIDNFDSAESDRQSALCAVEEKEHAHDYSGKWGPIGQTRKHWHDLTPVVEPRREPNRWQFQCKYCKAYVPFCV